MKLLLIYLSLIELAAADFGFPIRIVPLQKTVLSAIGTSIKPLQSALKVPTTRYELFQLATLNRTALARDVIMAAQATSQSLMVAAKDTSRGPSETFTKLTKVLTSARQKLLGARRFGQYFEINLAGSQFSAIIDRMISEHGKLREFVATLSEAASSAVKAGSVTTESIQKYIGSSHVRTLEDRIKAFMETVKSLTQEVQRFDTRLNDLTNVLDVLRNSTTNPVLISISPLKSIMRTSNIKMVENVKDYVESITNSYNLVLKETTLKNNSSVISFCDFVENATSNLTMLQSIEPHVLNQTSNFTELYLNKLNTSYELNFQTIIKSIANSTLDKSMLTSCVKVNPTLIKQLSAAQFMGLDCNSNLVRAAPVTRQVVDRFMSIFYTFVMQPIVDLATCNVTLDKEFCVENFETRHFQPYSRPSRIGMTQMIEAMFTTAFNNADYAIFRMEQCYEYAGKVYSRVLTELANFISDCVLKKST